jgi:hypothetical protein
MLTALLVSITCLYHAPPSPLPPSHYPVEKERKKERKKDYLFLNSSISNRLAIHDNEIKG